MTSLIIFFGAIYLAIFILVYKMAERRGRNALMFLLLALCISPFLTMLILLILGETEEHRKQTIIEEEELRRVARGENGEPTSDNNQLLINTQQKKKKDTIKKICIGVVIAVVVIGIGAAVGTSREDEIKKLEKAPVSNLSPNGELAQVFSVLSEYTDVQRENLEKSIKGKVVAWKLPVYDVRKAGDKYRIQTDNINYVGTVITLIPRNEEERKFIESLKENNIIPVKGIISGVTFTRHLEIEPAILLIKTKSTPTPEPEIVKETPANQESVAATANVPASSTRFMENYKVSFNCVKASSYVEDVICADPEIGQMDGLLATTYKSRKDPQFGADPAILKNEQMVWVQSRNRCNTESCVKDAYKQRIAELCSMPVVSGVHPESDCDAFITNYLDGKIPEKRYVAELSVEPKEEKTSVAETSVEPKEEKKPVAEISANPTASEKPQIKNEEKNVASDKQKKVKQASVEKTRKPSAPIKQKTESSSKTREATTAKDSRSSENTGGLFGAFNKLKKALPKGEAPKQDNPWD